MTPVTVVALKAGGHLENAEDLGTLNGATGSVRLWPDSPAKRFEVMMLLPTQSGNGVVKFIALSASGTIVLAFAMDVANGRVHTRKNVG